MNIKFVFSNILCFFLVLESSGFADEAQDVGKSNRVVSHIDQLTSRNKITPQMDSFDILRALRPKLVYSTDQGGYGENLIKYKKEIESLSPEELANLLLLINLTYKGISWSAENSESLNMVLRGCKNLKAAQKILSSMPDDYLDGFFKTSKKDLFSN